MARGRECNDANSDILPCLEMLNINQNTSCLSKDGIQAKLEEKQRILETRKKEVEQWVSQARGQQIKVPTFVCSHCDKEIVGMNKLKVVTAKNGVLEMSGFSSFILTEVDITKMAEKDGYPETLKSDFFKWWQDWGPAIYRKKFESITKLLACPCC